MEILLIILLTLGPQGAFWLMCMYFYFYSDCKENKGIYTSLHLEHLFNINEFLNISMVSKESMGECLIVFEGWRDVYS